MRFEKRAIQAQGRYSELPLRPSVIELAREQQYGNRHEIFNSMAQSRLFDPPGEV